MSLHATEYPENFIPIGIKETRTTPLHPQFEGIIEVQNRTINNSLSLFVSEHQRNWDKLVPCLLLSYRRSQHEYIGFTPVIGLSGRQGKLPIDLFFVNPPCSDENVISSRVCFFLHDFTRNRIPIASNRIELIFNQKVIY